MPRNKGTAGAASGHDRLGLKKPRQPRRLAAASERERVAAALRLLERPPRDWTQRLLPGGSNNRSYLVVGGGRQWVVKLRSAALGPQRDLREEARVTALAAAAGLAPPVEGVDAAAGVLITAYLPGAHSWSRRESRSPANIERIVAVLRRLHALRPGLPAYALDNVAAAYMRIVGTAERRTARRARELRAGARRFLANHAATAFCHNDLYASNVLDDGRDLLLIDFEYAVRAAPLLDLAGLAAMNGYSSRASAALLSAYYGGTPEVSAAELASTIRTLLLLAWFWAEANARTAAAPGAYRRLSREIDAQLGAD